MAQARVDTEAVLRDLWQARGGRTRGLVDLAEFPNAIRATSVVAFLVLWEVGARNIDPILFSTPSAGSRSTTTSSGTTPAR